MNGLVWNPIQADFKPISASTPSLEGLNGLGSYLKQVGEQRQAKENLKAYLAQSEALQRVSDMQSENKVYSEYSSEPSGLAGITVQPTVQPSITAPNANNGLSRVPNNDKSYTVNQNTVNRMMPYLGMVEKASQRTGVPVPYLLGIIQAESNFDPNAVSHTGVKGIAQTTRDVAREMGYDPNQRHLPEVSINAMADYLKKVSMPAAKGDLLHTAYAYNGGAGALPAIRSGTWKGNYWDGNISKQKEISAYGPRVIRYYNGWNNWYNNYLANRS